MVYKMKKERYNSLNMRKDEIIDMLNDDNNLLNIKQKSIVAEDKKTGEKQVIIFGNIGLTPMRIITDVVTY